MPRHLSRSSDKRKNRGFTLVYVLGILGLLALVAIGVAYRGSIQSNRLERQQIFNNEEAARESSKIIATNLLKMETNPELPDGWLSPWSSQVQLNLNEKTLTVQVEDEQGKFNVNLFQQLPENDRLYQKYKDIYKRLVQHVKSENPVIGKVMEKIPGLISTRRSKIINLDELKLLNKDLKSSEISVLGKWITTVGSNRINLNTAPEKLLYALFPGTLNRVARELIQYRGTRNKPGKMLKELSDINSFGSVQDMTEEDQQQLTSTLSGVATTRSSYFSAICNWGENIGQKSWKMIIQRIYEQEREIPGVIIDIPQGAPKITIQYVWSLDPLPFGGIK